MNYNPNYNPDEYEAVYRWDRPMVGLYDKGQIRVVTSIHIPTGRVGACHMADEKDLIRLERIHGVKFDEKAWAFAIAETEK
jgi:hypothetical protein